MSISPLLAKIEAYKTKYYQNRLLKGGLFTLGTIVAAVLVFSTIEYFGRFGSTLRAAMFWSFIGLAVYTLISWVITPLLYLLGLRKKITDQTAAQEIGRFFPDVKDKLINTLQLASNGQSSDFLDQAISQKTQELKFVKFTEAVNFKTNRKYLKYVLPPVGILLLLLIAAPNFIKGPSERIVNFKNQYAEPAPFSFKIDNNNLKTFKNEDYTLNVTLRGSALPAEAFVVYNGRRFKMDQTDAKHYNYTFSKLQSSLDFSFEAAGFGSDTYELEVIGRPNLLSFDVDLEYPKYLGKEDESLENIGNLVVPEGTIIKWKFKTSDTDSLIVQFDGEKPQLGNDGFGDRFSYARKAKFSNNYHIQLAKEDVNNDAKIDFYLSVIPDKYPEIQLEQHRDSTMFNYILMGGNIADDYGISALKLMYKTNKSEKLTSIDIPFNKGQNSQSFYYQLPLERLNLEPGDKLDYFVSVSDNDGVNGAKTTKSSLMSFAVPSNKALNQDIDKQVANTENELEKALEKSKKLKAELEQLEKRLKSKKDLDFQDKKQIEDLLKKREELMNQIQSMQEQFKELQQKQERFNQPSPDMQKKNELMKQMLEELTKQENEKMLDELKKLLEKNQDDKAMEQIEKMKNKDRNVDKELERALTLFKQLQLQQKVEKTAEDLNKLAEKQEKLAEKTEKQPDGKPTTEEQKKANEEIKKEQEKLNKELEEKKKDLEDIEKKSKEAKKPMDTDKAEKEMQDAQNEQQNAKEKMEQEKNSEAAQKQKKASKSMRNMAGALMEGMMSAEMKSVDEDIDALRDILENLIKLSVDEERLMKEFRGLNLSDPRFVQYSQEQLKLKDDAKVVEDSLYALSRRVMQLQSFITREVTDMNNNMDDALKYIRERKLNMVSAQQQFTMTSMNNLALMLSDAFKQMQAQMAAMMPGAGSGSGKKGKKPGESKMGESQKDLNKRMEKIQKGGKGTGRAQSEEIAKLAAEQGAMRRRISELQNELKGTELGKKLNGDLQELQKKMDETETDLVNKRINQELINRQRDILTRLLESEKAILQQEQDPNRTSKTGVSFERKVPPSFEKYIQAKQKQVELLLSVPPSYTPFYKRETDKYFKKVN